MPDLGTLTFTIPYWVDGSYSGTTGVSQNYLYDYDSGYYSGTTFVQFANYGMTKMGNIVYGSSGSIVTAIGAPRYCNLLLTVDGGASFSAPAVTFGLTRIG